MNVLGLGLLRVGISGHREDPRLDMQRQYSRERQDNDSPGREMEQRRADVPSPQDDTPQKECPRFAYKPPIANSIVCKFQLIIFAAT